jgi:pimeloyl-ACP methyl ester carboxylesterase
MFGDTPAAHAAAPGTPAQLGPVQQVRAGVLNTGYVETGPADGRAVILMHGFPYDIHSYAEVAPLLAAEGYRVIVPYFRGYGTTTFLSPATPRNVDQAAFALDILALMDALHIRDHRVLDVGHNVPQEDPHGFAQAVIDVDHL